MHERTSIQLSAADRRLPLSIQKRMRANALRRDRIAQVVKVTARNSSRKRATGGSPCFCQTRALLYRFGLRLPKGQKLWGLPTKQKLRLSASTCPRKADTNIRRDQQTQRRRVTMLSTVNHVTSIRAGVPEVSLKGLFGVVE